MTIPADKGCARDSGWCDGVICREQGIECAKQEVPSSSTMDLRERVIRDEAWWLDWDARVKANPDDLSLLLKEPMRPRWSLYPEIREADARLRALEAPDVPGISSRIDCGQRLVKSECPTCEAPDA